MGIRKACGVVGIVVAAVWSTGRAGDFERVEEKTFTMQPGGSVEIVADDGSVTIGAWGSPEVRVKMTMRAWSNSRVRAERALDAQQIEIRSEGNRLEIREHGEGDERGSDFINVKRGSGDGDDGVSIDFELSVPAQTDVECALDEGDIRVTGVSGSRVVLSSDEGDISLEDAAVRTISLDTDEGDIEVSGVRAAGGSISLETDEGGIRAEKCEADAFTADTDEGDVELISVKAQACSIATDEGEIEAFLDPVKSSVYTFEAGEGSVSVAVPEGASFRVQLETGEGSVESDFRLSRESLDEGELLEGRIGDGAGMLHVYTDEGDIVLTRRSVP